MYSKLGIRMELYEHQSFIVPNREEILDNCFRGILIWMLLNYFALCFHQANGAVPRVYFFDYSSSKLTVISSTCTQVVRYDSS